MRNICCLQLSLWLVLIVVAAGCAVTPYKYGRFAPTRKEGRMENVTIVQGSPGPLLIRFSNFVDVPARILPFAPKQLRHEISDESAQKVVDYMEKNDLADVYVCVNEYDPVGEWRRLKQNRDVSPVWRYSLGLLGFAGYVLFPHPVFCGNEYSPYTNRLAINIDDPASMFHEAAYAKNVHSRELPGTYVALTTLPGFSLFRELDVVNDVVGYSRAENDWESEKAAYRRLYPRIGGNTTMLGTIFLPVWWEGPLLGMGTSAVGYTYGRIVESHRLKELEALKKAPSNSSDVAIVAPAVVPKIPEWESVENLADSQERKQTSEP